MLQKKHINFICIAMGVYSGQLSNIAFCAGQPDFPTSINVNPDSVVEYRIVGITTQATAGNASFHDEDTNQDYGGFAAMDGLCKHQFGQSARFATADEWRTIRNVTFPDGTQLDDPVVWLDPGPVAPVYNPTSTVIDKWTAYSPIAARSSEYLSRDYFNGPYNAIGNMSCYSYFTNSHDYAGTYGAPNGYVALTRCDESLQVACAAPVRVPLTQ